MKKWRKLTALLLAVVMMLCACNPNPDNTDANGGNTTPNSDNNNGKLTITVVLPEKADYANITLNGGKIVKYTNEPLILDLTPGNYKLNFTALANNEINAIATYTKDITIEAKTYTVNVKAEDWIASSTETAATVTISGLPEYADFAKLSINDVAVETDPTSKNIELKLNKGSYTLKADAYSNDYSDTTALAGTTMSFEVTDNTAKTITLNNWTAVDLGNASFTFKCNTPSGVKKSEFILTNKVNGAYERLYLNHPKETAAGLYRLEAYAYGEDNKLFAIGSKTIVLKPGDNKTLEYTDFTWTSFTGESKNVTMKIGLDPYADADSYAILLNNELKGSNTTGNLTLDDTYCYNVNGYAFNKGNLLSHVNGTEYPRTARYIGITYCMFERELGYLDVINNDLTDATSYKLKIDNGEFIDINAAKNMPLAPGDHHMEAYAFNNGNQCIAVVYKEFNIREYLHSTINLEWNADMNFNAFKSSIEDEIRGYSRMDNIPLNILPQEKLNIMADQIATAIKIPKDNIKPVVENNNLTVDIDLVEEKWHLTQSTDGTLKNEITTGNTVETIYYANLPDFNFDHAKITSDYNTASGFVTENGKVTSRWASFLITSKEELVKFMAVNGFSLKNNETILNNFDSNPTVCTALIADAASPISIVINPRKADATDNIYNIQIYEKVN